MLHVAIQQLNIQWHSAIEFALIGQERPRICGCLWSAKCLEEKADSLLLCKTFSQTTACSSKFLVLRGCYCKSGKSLQVASLPLRKSHFK